MKKAFILLLFFLCTKLYAQYQVIEQTDTFYTQITLCGHKSESYVLIVNGYEDLPLYLVVYPDKEYTARRVYGEILLKYYEIKNAKKEYRAEEGNFYYTNADNSEEEVIFLMSLTNSFLLAEYPSYFVTDENNSKDELVEFYDWDGTQKEATIGSSAGILMGIKAGDFIKYIKNYR